MKSFRFEDLVAALLVLFIGLIFGIRLIVANALPVNKPGFHLVDNPRIKTPKKREVPLLKLSPPEGGGRAKRELREPSKGQLFKIGIIDTGFDKTLDKTTKLCDSGHYDFNTDTSTVGTTDFHGTAVAKAISDQLEGVNYCIVVFQVGTPLGITTYAVQAALKKASAEGLTAVNISLEGPIHSFDERQAIRKLVSKGTAVFVAAGNRHMNLDEACMSYPSCYDLPNVYVVGAAQDDGQFKTPYSNYGSKVSVWEEGTIEFEGRTYRGTSFASPRALGHYVSALAHATSGE